MSCIIITEAQSVTTFSEGMSIEEFTDFLKKEGLCESDCKLLIESKMPLSFSFVPLSPLPSPYHIYVQDEETFKDNHKICDGIILCIYHYTKLTFVRSCVYVYVCERESGRSPVIIRSEAKIFLSPSLGSNVTADSRLK